MARKSARKGERGFPARLFMYFLNRSGLPHWNSAIAINSSVSDSIAPLLFGSWLRGRGRERQDHAAVSFSESAILSKGLGKPKHLPNAYHASLNGRSQQLCRVGHAHLSHHVRPVGFNRFDADLEPLAHFFISEAGPNQLEDFLLATGQGLGPLLSRRRSEVDKRGLPSDSRGSCHFIYSLN